ncbi:hypothetical protein BK139_12985 [Paenibacillus sp. FSL R5-0490]|uniref:Ig-like domain-containing protein n=1 Tax=Paenibacillus sp. FSL R5-0490 TaxID=1920424 RepID=UPI00096D2FE7|nr:Ig-like domain-containing protein [Paenibacillus sp. FSL R5-0490]OMF59315.1 hypothetical protein BK139_12985 [Paenibacillus sp. FSL R5-0490]
MKNFTPAVAAVLALGMVFSGPAFAAPKDNPKSEKVQKVKENQQSNKGQTQQLKSIDKQLDKIEEKITHYQEKLQNLYKPIEDNVDVSEEEPIREDNSDSIDNDDTNEVDEADSSIDEEAGEVEEELNEYPGYAGKFNALQNRLDAVNNRLDSLAAKGTAAEEWQSRYGRIELLSTQINEVLTTLKELQNDVQEKVDNDESAEELEPTKSEVPASKEWNIKFSQKLNEKTLSNLDIIVLDTAENLIETSISYSEETKSITIKPAQPYKAGETYTLYIGKDISGENGLKLKNSVKMTFSIE